MIRTAFALLLVAFFGASPALAQQLRPVSLGDSLRTLDALRREEGRSLEQVFVLPERPGQNKVSWYDFDWRWVDLPPPGGGPGGIRVYYYRSEAPQLSRAIPAILSAYARLVEEFRYSPTKRIPYLLFATQREFQAQNVFQVTESVLGVTSPSDLKMSVPYFGDHARFTEVSTHEMVHQFTIQKLIDAAGRDEPASAILHLPLWFIEGIAEYYTKGGIDAETDHFLRDLVANPDPRKGYAVLPFAEDRARGYIPTYKLGQARIAFIAETYGKEKIQAFLENASLLAGAGGRQEPGVARGFGALVRRVLNEPLEQVDGRWRAWMKRRYYAAYLDARQDLPDVRELRGLAFEPEDFAASPDGTVAAVRGIDRARGRARLYLVHLRNPKGAVAIASDNEPGSESLHPIEHSIAAVGSRVVVWSAQDGVGDSIYLRSWRKTERKGRPPGVSVGGRREVDVRPPEGDRFIQVIDPALSPDEEELAFVGVARDGQRDVYVAPLSGGTARRLTNDAYAERDVAWGPAGIHFASDATDHGRTNLFRIDPATGAVTRLTTGPWNDRHPVAGEDGKVYFASEASGKSDLHVLEDGAVRRLTDFTTGLESPALAPGGGLLASTFHGASFRIVEVPKLAFVKDPAVPVPPAAGGVLPIPEAPVPEEHSDYTALSASSWRPEGIIVYGGGGGGSVAGRAAALFSDTLRDHSVFVDVSVYGSFDYTQGIAIYENRAQRLGWIGGGFHFVQLEIDRVDPGVAFLQREYGAVGALRWPLDRFRRFDLELTVSGVRRECPANYTSQTTLVCGILMEVPDPTDPGETILVPDPDRQAAWEERNGGTQVNFQPAIRFGYDTIRYDPVTGPLAGRSLLAEVGGGWLPRLGVVHGFARLDAQAYAQLAGRANIGLRLAAGTSVSDGDASRNWARTWWLTSSDNLRGFDPFDTDFLTGRHYWVANLELQFPVEPILRLALFDFVEGVAALDFGGVFDHWETRPVPPGAPITRADAGAWDARTLTGVLGLNFVLGPLLLRLHFGHPYDVGGLETPALARGSTWVTNFSLRYSFF